MDVVFANGADRTEGFSLPQGVDERSSAINPAFYAKPIERLRIEGGPRHKLPLLLYYLPR
jgi:hypothetical protein